MSIWITYAHAHYVSYKTSVTQVHSEATHSQWRIDTEALSAFLDLCEGFPLWNGQCEILSILLLLV